MRRTSNWSSWRHRCETLIVTRSRKASSSSGSRRSRWPYSARSGVPRRAVQVRTRRSIWLRLYWPRSTPQSERTSSQSATKSSALRPATETGGGAGERHAPASRAIARGARAAAGLVGQAGLGDRARHAVDDAGRLGLGQHAATGGLDGAGALEPVLAHAGQDDQDQRRAEQLRGVGDREVGTRAQAAQRRVVGQPDAAVGSIRRCAPPGARQAASGSSRRRRRPRRRCSVEALSRRGASEAVNPAGMCWTISEPEPSGDGRRGISSPSALGRRSRTRSRRTARGRAPADATRGAAGGGRRDGQRPAAAQPPLRRVVTLRASSAVKSASDSPSRLGEEVDRALGERVDGAGAMCGGERRHHDDRADRPCRRAGAQHAEAVRPGICRSSVIASGRARAGGQRLVAVGRRGAHVEGLASQGIGRIAAHEPGVISDDDALPRCS